jgi:hypothetical protein
MVAYGHHQVDRLIQDRIHVLRIEALHGQARSLQRRDRTFGDPRLRIGAGGERPHRRRSRIWISACSSLSSYRLWSTRILNNSTVS